MFFFFFFIFRLRFSCRWKRNEIIVITIDADEERFSHRPIAYVYINVAVNSWLARVAYDDRIQRAHLFMLAAVFLSRFRLFIYTLFYSSLMIVFPRIFFFLLAELNLMNCSNWKQNNKKKKWDKRNQTEFPIQNDKFCLTVWELCANLPLYLVSDVIFRCETMSKYIVYSIESTVFLAGPVMRQN